MPDLPPAVMAVVVAAAIAPLVPLSMRHVAGVVGGAFVLLGAVRVEPAPTDLLLALALAGGLMTRRLLVSRVPPLVLFLLGAFAGLNVYAVTYAVDRSLSIRYVLITLFLLAVACLMPMLVTGPHRARLLVRCYLLGAVPLALLSVLALLWAFPYSDSLLGYRGTRARGLFKDPNVFGPALIPAAMILLDEILHPRLLTSPRLLRAAMLAICLAGVLFSYSRAAWINVVAALVVMLVVQLLRGADGGKRLVMSSMLVLVLAGGTALLVSTTSSGDFLSERAQLQTYDAERFGAQAKGLELATSNPVTGVGPGQFEVVAPISAHSLYVRVATETGLPGLAVLGCLLALTLGLAVHHVLQGQDSHGIGSAPLLASWIGLLVNSAVVDTLHWRHLWIVAGLIYVAEARRRTTSTSRDQGGHALLLPR